MFNWLPWRRPRPLPPGASRPKIVVIGAGFGGLQVARKLARQPVDVTLLDRNNYHLFTPLLYQVASSLLNPSDIAQPVRAIVRGAPNVRFQQATVTGVEFAAKHVHTAEGRTIPYDNLVIAVGSTTNYFGIESVASSALGLKDLPEALELRNHVLGCLERASSTTDAAERARLLTFLVVGGGPTGVEYAGALNELVRLVVPSEYLELARSQVRILLVEALPSLLNAFPGKLGISARKTLEERGIEVRTATRVLGVAGGLVSLSGEDPIPSETIVWAAGVKPESLAGTIDVPRSRSGRIEVNDYLAVNGIEGVFAIGDAASFEQNGTEVPMLSSPAMQAGRLVAANILRELHGEAPKPFRYRDKGSMATIGRNAAVASVGRLRLQGFLGWLAWLVVHLYFLIGFRNRVTVLIGWAWNYVRFDRPVRIIARARGRGDSPSDRRPNDP